MKRREFIGGMVMAGLAGCRMLDGKYAYPGRKEGEMDIHFIHTGTGECTFIVMPDGTTMLIDCGHAAVRKPGYAEAVPAKPSDEFPAGEWIRRYLERVSPSNEIDYLMISHWHRDHVEGLPDVTKTFRFGHYTDHQYPKIAQYKSNVSPTAVAFMREWLPAAIEKGMKAEAFKPGKLNQIRLLHDREGKYKGVFSVRNVAANGVVWDGKKGTRDFVSTHLAENGGKSLNENMLSASIVIRYGKFSYYTGGDTEGRFLGAGKTQINYEAEVAKAAGKVTAMKSNHHAYISAMTAECVKELQPKVIVSSVWSPNQVNDITLPNMTSRELYGGKRTIYFGAMPKGKREAYAGKEFMKDLAKEFGHAVIKVAKGGETFKVFVLNADNESMEVLSEENYTA